MEVPGPRMSLLYDPTHRKCLCSLLAVYADGKVVSCSWSWAAEGGEDELSLSNGSAGLGVCMFYSLDLKTV